MQPTLGWGQDKDAEKETAGVRRVREDEQGLRKKLVLPTSVNNPLSRAFQDGQEFSKKRLEG